MHRSLFVPKTERVETIDGTESEKVMFFDEYKKALTPDHLSLFIGQRGK